MEINPKLLEDCKKGKRQAQKEVYDTWSSILLGICMRYLHNIQEAEDVLQESFVKIFTHINDFKGDGSFEGWMKRIVVNTTLNQIKKNRRINEELEIDTAYNLKSEAIINLENYDSKIILNELNNLPDGYRIILNLYAIEGFSHKEIANEMGIAESTSRSQFLRAKAFLKKKLENYNIEILNH